jgi:TonB-dependent receptor
MRSTIRRYALLLLMSFAAAPVLLAQGGRGSISGTVTDSSGSVLQGAQVLLQPAGISMVTTQQGQYLITGLAAGEYTLTITYLGFDDFTKAITVTGGQVTTVSAKMTVHSQKAEVIVTGERGSGEAAEINREKTADNVLQVISSEVITALPNANIADAVGRLPGVTLERDEGEGKYIQVRSLEPRLTNATIDGVNVPSPEPGVREIKFDAMPADLVDSVEVNKTLQANMDGDGIGGSVNIVTKTAGERPTLDLFGAGGITPIMGNVNVYQAAGTVGQRFGADKRWGILVGGSYDWNGRGIHDIEPVPDAATFPDGSSTRYFDTQDIREYRYKRSRWGVTGSADYKLGDGSDIYIRGIYSSFRDFGDKWVYTLTDNTQGIQLVNSGNGANVVNGCALDNNGFTTAPCTGVPHFSTSNRVPIFNIGSVVLGGKHVLATTWVSWDVSVSRAEQVHSGGDEGADFSSNLSSSACQFSPALTTKQYVPQWTPNCFTEAYQPATYSLADINTSFGQSPQLNLQFAGAIGKRYHIGSHVSTIEVGGKFRNAHKFDDSYTPTYTPNGNLPMTQFLGTFTDTNYYSNNYPLGPVSSWSKLISYLNANPSQFTLQPGTTGVNPGNFDYVEKVSAGYVMDTIDFSKVRLVAGIRFEGTNLTSYTPGFDDSGNFLGNTKILGSYVKALPSASVRIDLGHDSDVRVVYSRALSRPDPVDIAQALTVTISQSPMTASIANPNLKAETANNYDLLFEHYLKPFGAIQAGFFYKQLYDPIASQSQEFFNYSPDPGNARYPVGTWIVTQPINAGFGWVEGLEFAYLQHYTSLPGMLSGLGLSANYTYTNSAACQLPGRADCPRLLRQAPNAWNFSPTFDRGKLSIRVGLTYNDSSIYSYQYQDGTGGATPTPGGLNGPLSDTYLYPHFQLDAQGSYQLPRGFTVMAYGLNLNNEVFGFYNGQAQYMIQREYYGPTFAFGMRWSPLHEK